MINQSRIARTAWLEEVQSKQLHPRFSGSRSYKLFAANYWQFSTRLKEIKTVSSTIINQGSEYESKQDVSSGNVDCEQSKRKTDFLKKEKKKEMLQLECKLVGTVGSIQQYNASSLYCRRSYREDHIRSLVCLINYYYYFFITVKEMCCMIYHSKLARKFQWS